MNLFKVTAEVVVYLLAGDEGDAFVDASEAVPSEIDGNGLDTSRVRVQEVTKIDQIEAKWRESFPYSLGTGDVDLDGLTTLEVFARIRARDAVTREVSPSPVELGLEAD